MFSILSRRMKPSSCTAFRRPRSFIAFAFSFRVLTFPGAEDWSWPGRREQRTPSFLKSHCVRGTEHRPAEFLFEGSSTIETTESRHPEELSAVSRRGKAICC